MSPSILQIPQPPQVVLAAVGEAAEMWGADWRPGGNGGRVGIPIVQGIRQGVVVGILRVEPNPSGCSLDLEIEETQLVVNRSALAILLLGALGGVSVMLWPLSPKILQLAPLGAVLALVAWLLVVSRIRNSDPGDFLALVSELAAQA